MSIDYSATLTYAVVPSQNELRAVLDEHDADELYELFDLDDFNLCMQVIGSEIEEEENSIITHKSFCICTSGIHVFEFNPDGEKFKRMNEDFQKFRETYEKTGLTWKEPKLVLSLDVY